MSQTNKGISLMDASQIEGAVDELHSYLENKFTTYKNISFLEEPYIKVWEEYYKESQENGAFETLRKYLVQLQFPIQKGISKTEEYINSSLKGKEKVSKSELILNQPELITLEIYKSSLIGKVPVIIVPNNDDFNSIVCALSNKNEPKNCPKSMGASFINGINNWDRIYRLKKHWFKNNPYGNWIQEFKKNILPNPYLYRDKLIVLSTKPYSGVDSNSMGVSKNKWKSNSLTMRKEHECAHLFTLKQYGTIANNIHDEIVADYTGITNVLGQFSSEWFLQFIGLEDYPNYREGGRLENYLINDNLSKEAFNLLKTIVKNSAENIAEFDKALGQIKHSRDRINRIRSICEVDLITMSSANGIERLMCTYMSF